MKLKVALTSITLFCFGPLLWSQIIPVSEIETGIHSTETPASLIYQLDMASAESPLYYHAKGYPVNLNLADTEPRADGHYNKIQASALAIRVFLNIDHLYGGDTLFILNSQGKRAEFVCAENLYQHFWSSRLYNDELTLYYKNTSGRESNLELESYSLELPKSDRKQTEDFQDSGPCEVNINCTEGSKHQNLKKSVVRILIKQGSNFSWCTGTFLNNTAYDSRPLIITAEHCALLGSSFVSAADLARWVFYFNYESPDCNNPASETGLNTEFLTGATLLSRSDDGGGDDGSDFTLLELKLSTTFEQDRFESFEPYFAGWNRINEAPENGVVIHHPQGDIKKISTYISPAKSGEYGNTTFDTHWLVNWSQTTNGHGVTEAGSSGSALLNRDGLVTGILTGGNASCNNTAGEDYFGKLSYSWTSNGSAKNRQLAPWLDPVNSGALALNGMFSGDSIPEGGLAPLARPTLLVGDKILKIQKASSTETLEVHIFDINGKLIHNSGEFALPSGTEREIDLNRLPSGFYFVRILRNGAKPNTTKIVIGN